MSCEKRWWQGLRDFKNSHENPFYMFYTYKAHSSYAAESRAEPSHANRNKHAEKSARRLAEGFVYNSAERIARSPAKQIVYDYRKETSRCSAE